MIPPSPLGCSSAAEPAACYVPSRAPFQLNRHPTSPSQPSQEAPRLHPVGSAPLVTRPSSPSSTISENESPRSETSSQGDLSADDGLPAVPADKQSDSGRRHACPHCAKRFNRPSSLAIHVNTHTGDKRKLIRKASIQPAHLPSPPTPKHSNARSQIAEENSTSTLICAATTGNISVQRLRRHPDRGRSIRLRDLLVLAYRSYDITTINQKTWEGSHPLIPLIPGTPAQRTHGGELCKSCMTPPSCVRLGSRTVKVEWTVCASFVSSVLDSLMYSGIAVTSHFTISKPLSASGASRFSTFKYLRLVREICDCGSSPTSSPLLKLRIVSPTFYFLRLRVNEQPRCHSFSVSVRTEGSGTAYKHDGAALKSG